MLKINPLMFHKISFKSGVTNIYSDFDGTYMPDKYNHDSMVKDTPYLNRYEFKTYFERFRKLFENINGKKNNKKLNFVITTGRNINEFNYVMQKLKEKGLEIPLPDSLITCNGGDEFFLKNPQFFKNDTGNAFFKEDVNNDKIKWIKKASGGWNGKKIRKSITKALDNAIIYPNNAKRDNLLGRINPETHIHRRIDWVSDIFEKQRTEEELRHYLESCAKPILDSLHGKEKDDLKWEIGEVAYEITETKKGKNRMHVVNAPTNQCNWSYPGNISLQSVLESMNPRPQYYASIRDDGDLNFHIAYPWVYTHRSELSYKTDTNFPLIKQKNDAVVGDLNLKDLFKENNEKIYEYKFSETDSEAFNTDGEKTAAVRIKPYLKSTGIYLETGGELDKFHDIQKKAKEIIDKNLNDLIIVAGDGSNDIKALNLKNYLGQDNNFNWDDKDKIEKLKNLPIISIFVKNKDIKGYQPYSQEQLFNADGILRYIIVDPNNPDRPGTLQEAIEIAIKFYAERNKTFKKNLSEEMKKIISKKYISYPVQKLLTEEDIKKRSNV